MLLKTIKNQKIIELKFIHVLILMWHLSLENWDINAAFNFWKSGISNQCRMSDEMLPAAGSSTFENEESSR